MYATIFKSMHLCVAGSIYGAYSMWMYTKERWWNSRKLAFGFEIPSRDFQLEVFRWMFVLFYILTGALMSAILMDVSGDNSNFWSANIAMDVILVVVFLVYCRNVHRQDGATVPRCFLFPQKSFVLFPGRSASLF